jgi:hypothetical protein
MNPAESYILSQAEPYKSILLQLKNTVERTVPEVSLKFRYGIPFYYLLDKPFCYLNQSGNYVDLGFYRAAWLTRHLDQMESRGRKYMKSLRYRSLDAIDIQVLEEVLEEALQVQDRPSYKPG